MNAVFSRDLRSQMHFFRPEQSQVSLHECRAPRSLKRAAGLQPTKSTYGSISRGCASSFGSHTETTVGCGSVQTRPKQVIPSSSRSCAVRLNQPVDGDSWLDSGDFAQLLARLPDLRSLSGAVNPRTPPPPAAVLGPARGALLAVPFPNFATDPAPVPPRPAAPHRQVGHPPAPPRAGCWPS